MSRCFIKVPQQLQEISLSLSSRTQITRTKLTVKMSRPIIHPIIKLYLLLLLVQTHFSVLIGASVLEDGAIDALVKRGRTQKIGECYEAVEVESEISRRVLVMQKRYISYETLRRDMVPCAKPGASYYACHAGEANTYSRGCEVITRCARG